MLCTILYLIGLITVLYTAIPAVASIFYLLTRECSDLKIFGKWGVVTGATDGIGKALAIELAKKGMNVLLISRTQSKLDEVKASIEKEYKNVIVKTLQCDFSSLDATLRSKVKKTIDSLSDIGVLFNNVGTSYDFPQYFHELKETQVENILKINIDSTVFMTHIVLAGMVERKRGAIINLSSGSASLCVPLLTEYSATKKFVEQFTQCLAAEYQSSNVHIQCHSPMFVATKLAKIRTSSLFTPTPETYAKAAVAQIGGETFSSPYLPHFLQLFVYRLVPTSLMSMVAMKMHIGLRKKALKKLEEKTKLT